RLRPCGRARRVEARRRCARVQDHGRQLSAAHGANPRRYDARSGSGGLQASARRASAGRGRHDGSTLGPLSPAGALLGMRYPTVLFDLDGTLIDSGEIILSSFRHATQTVLDREIPDEVLAGAIGGSNIYEQMRAFDEERADELVRVYREHNEP